jgi:amidophosphoribosyltransferase
MITTDPFADDKLKEECGVFGIFGNQDAAAWAALGLHALQHRGQEAAGIVSFDGRNFNAHRDQGHVGDIFGKPKVMESLAGNAAIGHVRYSTAGGSALRNVQPLFADLDVGGLALAHNGNLTNALELRQQLVRQGSIFQSTSDTEVIMHLTATAREGNLIDRLVTGLRQVEGAYSLVAMTETCTIGLRDPRGVRPLVLGRVGDSYIVTSETCALDIVGAQFVRDVEPGEMVVLDSSGVHSIRPFAPARSRGCIFEFIYFARPDSVMNGESVYKARKSIGQELARESHVPADVVVPVPDSGVPAAIGYAQEAKIPFELGIIRNHYVGRTFIEPGQQIRHLGVKLKHNANSGALAGKRVVLVDDSIVRGTTAVKIVELVRAAGATEVHMRIAAPPTAFPCFYGIDTPSREELMASQMSVEEMGQHIGVDSLAFVTMDGLYRAMGESARDNTEPQYCDACFSGDYPIALVDQEGGNAGAQLSLLTELA